MFNSKLWRKGRQFWSTLDSSRAQVSDDVHSRILPTFSVVKTLNYLKAFTSPNPDVKATIIDVEEKVVGRVTYAVSPLHDRLYLFNIEVEEAYKRKGFGLAIVHYLLMTYQLPITTVKEVFSASDFWTAARKMAGKIGGTIATMSVSEMPDEAARWAYLKPENDRLEALITQRFLRGEAYESAVGRGLDG